MEMKFRMRLKELARCAESEARRELGSKGRLEYGTFSHSDWKRLKTLTNTKFWWCWAESPHALCKSKQLESNLAISNKYENNFVHIL